MNRLFALLLALLLPLSLAGCPSPSGDDDDDTVADDDDSDEECDDDDAAPEETCDVEVCTPDATSGVVHGTVTDGAGDPLACISLTVCNDQSCLFGTTADNGAWCVDGLPPGDYVVHNVGHPGSTPPVNQRRWSSFYDFVSVTADTDTAVDNAQVVPFMPEAARVEGPWTGETELAWGDLTVGFNGDQVEFPFPTAQCLDEITLSALEVPASDWPVHGLMGWEVIGAWAFSPFETLQEDGNGDPVPFDVSVPVGVQDTNLEYGLLYADYEHNISTATFSVGTGALVDTSIVGTVGRLSLLLAVKR